MSSSGRSMDADVRNGTELGAGNARPKTEGPRRQPSESPGRSQRVIHVPEERQDGWEKACNRNHASRIAQLAAESKVGVSPVLTKRTRLFAGTGSPYPPFAQRFPRSMY